MSEEENDEPRVPLFKIIMDDIILLLFLGVTIYAVFYLLWGVMEIATVPNLPEDFKNSILK